MGLLRNASKLLIIQMHKKVLITGGSGLVGSRLSVLLQQKGYQISHLSRTASEGEIPIYQWDVHKGKMDARALNEVETIVHLAGAGIADRPWSPERKKEILTSRVQSTQLLFSELKNRKNQVKTLVCASAIGYYGNSDSSETYSEESASADDFLADVVKQWEHAADQIRTLGVRVVKIRIGILLSPEGGALAELMRPIKWGIGSPLGSGRQLMSWIHIDDVCGIFIKAIEDESMEGAYNAVSPNPSSNAEVVKEIGRVLKKPIWLPNVPEFLLKLVLGEMADLVIKGARISADKVIHSGYQFEYPNLRPALSHLLGKENA